MDKTEILIVRHGESMGNRERIFAGHFDVDLTERGYMQAEATADFLKNEKIDAIYSSDLKRAYNTALPHAAIHELRVNTSKALREINIGILEGADIKLIAKRRGPSFLKYWTEDFGLFAFLGGESTIEAGERFFDALKDIAKAHLGQCILITAHAGVIRAFWGKISKIDPVRLGVQIPFASNASVNRVNFENGEFIPISYSENQHLMEKGL